jgi:threonine aldolase
MGGGMRQAGYLAAAGIFALQNNIARLKIDNDRAKDIGEILKNVPFVKNIRPIKSNIIIFDLDGLTAEEFKIKLKNEGILCTGFGPYTIRFVFHLDISDVDYEYVKDKISQMA